MCFNLAIEMLVILGLSQARTGLDMGKFQSRNRDACHFRSLSREKPAARICFNLAIEMLVILGSV